MPQQLQKLNSALFSKRFPHFAFLSTGRNRGVALDSSLTFTGILQMLNLLTLPTSQGYLQTCFIVHLHSFIQDISIAPLRIHYYSEALTTTPLILFLSKHPEAYAVCRG